MLSGGSLTHPFRTRSDRPNAGPTQPVPRTQIAELADCRLRRNAYLTAEEVHCDFSRGRLTLRGRLSSYYLKQLAQEAISGLEGVREIRNEIEVVSSTRRACP
jgi:hypothetical protein